jgi:hypothetical protein
MATAVSAYRAIGRAERDASPPFVATLPPTAAPAAAAFIGTGAARSGRINSMGIGKTIVEF